VDNKFNHFFFFKWLKKLKKKLVAQNTRTI
jgi:hypothetical protein